ncbi:MAG TPA: PQQ-dependent sugar dehydrogenase, partial [Gemmatimonadales bacterium]|nr:PQQ-dependent sugar dehydrogenase [Gemmatimonadales bacterium]
MNRTVLASAIALALGSTLYVAAQQPPQGPPGGRGRGGFGPPGGGPETGLNTRPENAPDQKPAFAGQHRVPEQKLNVAFNVVTVTEGLVSPWGLVFLPDGRMLVTEKPGRLRVVSADGKQISEPVSGLPMVDARGQGGLLDVSIDPAFQKNQLIYWSF